VRHASYVADVARRVSVDARVAQAAAADEIGTSTILVEHQLLLLHEWREFCVLHTRLHEAESNRCRFLNNMISFPAIILSSVASLATVFQGVASTADPVGGANWLSVGFGLLGVTSSGLFVTQQVLALPEQQRDHHLFSCEYEKLSKEIQLHIALCADASSRTFANVGELLKHCKKTLDTLHDRAPPVQQRPHASSSSSPLRHVVVHPGDAPVNDIDPARVAPRPPRAMRRTQRVNRRASAPP
jgi:hypothetical protein